MKFGSRTITLPRNASSTLWNWSDPTTSCASFSRLSSRRVLSQNAGILLSNFVIFLLWHRQTQCNRILMACTNLRHSFSIKWIDSFRSLALFIVAMTQLSEIIVTPRVEGALSSQNESHASFRDLEIDYVKFIYTFDSVRSVKLTEYSLAPHEQLLVGWHSCWKLTSTNLNHFWKGEFFK